MTEVWPFRKNYRWGIASLDEGEHSGWYLECVSFDSMENHLGNARHTLLIELLASTEALAIAEARELWARRRPYVGWDQRQYPADARVVYVSRAEVGELSKVP